MSLLHVAPSPPPRVEPHPNASTLTVAQEKARLAEDVPTPHLIVAFERADAYAASWVIPLRSSDDITIGRGTTRKLQRSPADRRRLELTLADPMASSKHAMLVHIAGLWRILDLGSKNGTALNDEPCAEAELQD